MGGKRLDAKRLTLPRGVSLREFKTEERFQVAFSYMGEQCRELLPPQAITQTNANLAGGLRAEILRKIDLGTFVYRDYFPTSTRAAAFDKGGAIIQMAKLLDDQLETYARQVKNSTLSPSTYEGYRKALTGVRMKFWREMTLAEASKPAHLRKWVTELGLTAKASRNLLTPLRSIFEDALNDELIDANPFDKVALSKLLRQTSKASDYEVDPFTQAERDALYKAARADERPMLEWWFNVGLRPGELIAARWDRVDWVAHKFRVNTNIVAKTEKDPKTAAGRRDVDLNAQALAALQAQKAASFLAGQHIWLNPRTGKAWETDAQIRKTLWEPLCKRAGVRYRNPYQVRHTYASSLLTAGENPWYVANQLGHVDVQMVFRIYGKFIPQDYQRQTAGPSSKTEAPGRV